MRRLFYTAGLMLCATGAIAADFPLEGIFGNEVACAIVAQQPGASGSNVSFGLKDLRWDGALCNYTAVTEVTAADGAKSYEVKIGCMAGHDDVLQGTLNVAEDKTDPAQSKIIVTKVSGDGPEGEFLLCTPPGGTAAPM